MLLRERRKKDGEETTQNNEEKGIEVTCKQSQKRVQRPKRVKL